MRRNMVKVQCVGRRRLQISKREDGNYEIKIILTGPERLIATLVAEPKEFDKMKEAWKI